MRSKTSVIRGKSLYLENQNSTVFQEDDEEFVRKYELENDRGCLYLIQRWQGDVNCVVWDAALLLAKYLENKCTDDENFFNGKKVVELGSGLGLVGLVASYYGGQVTMTDLTHALDLLKLNLRKNKNLIDAGKGSARVQMLDWNEDGCMEPCDVILASDCIYYQESLNGFIKTLKRLSTDLTEIYLAQEERSHSEIQTLLWKNFTEEISKSFRVRVIPPQEQHKCYRSEDIYLLKLMKI